MTKVRLSDEEEFMAKAKAKRIRVLLMTVLLLACLPVRVFADDDGGRHYDISEGDGQVLTSHGRGGVSGHKDTTHTNDSGKNNGGGSSKGTWVEPANWAGARSSQANIRDIILGAAGRCDMSGDVRFDGGSYHLSGTTTLSLAEMEQIAKNMAGFYSSLGSDYLNSRDLMNFYNSLASLSGGGFNLNMGSDNGAVSAFSENAGLHRASMEGSENMLDLGSLSLDFGGGLTDAQYQALLNDFYNSMGGTLNMDGFDFSGVDLSSMSDDDLRSLFGIGGTASPLQASTYGIRSDLVNGGFNDMANWDDRFRHLLNEYLTMMNNTNGQLSTGGTDMERISVSRFIDYYCERNMDQEIETVDFTSDAREWTIRTEGGGIVRQTVSDDVSHTYVFGGLPEGDYVVTTRQWGRYIHNFVVDYYRNEYITDSYTNTILYFNERDVVGEFIIEGFTEEGWIPTGDVFRIHVNALGQVTYPELTSTERIK